MLDEIGNEMKKFIKDLEKNIKDEQDLKYILDRSQSLFKNILSNVKEFSDNEEKKLIKLLNKQKSHEKRIVEIENKMEVLDENMERIYKDIYEDEEGEFKIICPYCNFEFFTNFEENEDEIICPDCKNTIEIDWNSE